MKILVISDTHGNISNAERLIQKLNPDYVYHLGDMCEDCRRLENAFPMKIIASVKGNNDFFDKSYPSERCFELGGKRIYMCHGHKFNVKSSLLSLIYKGKEVCADIVLYGHTHRAHLETIDGMTVMNPGASNTYGLLEIDNDEIKAEIKQYEN